MRKLVSGERLHAFLRRRREGRFAPVAIDELERDLGMDQPALARAIAELESSGCAEVLPSSDTEPLRVRLLEPADEARDIA
jgi:DNA-binding MarR family transcriptional regulator